MLPHVDGTFELLRAWQRALRLQHALGALAGREDRRREEARHGASETDARQLEIAKRVGGAEDLLADVVAEKAERVHWRHADERRAHALCSVCVCGVTKVETHAERAGERAREARERARKQQPQQQNNAESTKRMASNALAVCSSLPCRAQTDPRCESSWRCNQTRPAKANARRISRTENRVTTD